MPLICKLTDFGESRSQDIRTNTILHSKTNQVNRGTPVFMAPELLVNDFQLPAASVEDLKKADIWAYGMVLFNLINPGLKHLFQINIKMKQAGTSLEEFLKAKQKPIAQKKYVLKQSNEWKRLAEIYEACTEFEPSLRPSAKDVFDSLQVNSGNLINQFQSVEKTTEQISRYVAIVLVHSRSSYIV
jgi:serine/threonine protein kinase